MMVDLRNEITPHEPLPESRFIAPDDRCPHPERWSSTDGASTEVEVTELVAAFVRGLQPDLVVETGAAFGQTTREISEQLEKNKHGTLVAYEIDETLWGDLIHLPRVEVKGDSLEANLSGYGSWVDLAFLDSNYETRVPEFKRMRRWWHRGTIVIFHDTSPGHGAHRIEGEVSLRDQIERDLVRPGEVKAIDLPTPRGLTICEVIDV